MCINEKWFEGLHSDDVSKFQRRISNENDPLNRENFIHELAVGHLLYKSGFTNLRYEQTIADNQTPDWTIYNDDGSIHFILEVLTVNTQKEILDHQEFIKELSEELRTIEKNVKIKMSFTVDVDFKNLRDINIEEIKNGLIEWLDSAPVKDDILELGEIYFLFVENTDSGIIIENDYVILYDSQPYRMLNLINDKINKYKDFLTENDIPFVVAVYNTFFSRVRPAELYEMLNQPTFKIVDHTEKVSYERINPMIKDRNLEHFSSILIIEDKHGKWFAVHNNGNWSIGHIENTHNARNGLQEGVFSNLSKLDNIPDEKIDDFLEGKYTTPGLDELFKFKY